VRANNAVLGIILAVVSAVLLWAVLLSPNTRMAEACERCLWAAAGSVTSFAKLAQQARASRLRVALLR
jgi:hypothetical protein